MSIQVHFHRFVLPVYDTDALEPINPFKERTRFMTIPIQINRKCFCGYEAEGLLFEKRTTPAVIEVSTGRQLW